MTLNKEQIDFYNTNGFVVISQMYNEKEISKMLNASKNLEVLAEVLIDMGVTGFHWLGKSKCEIKEAGLNRKKYAAYLERVIWAGGSEEVLLEYARDTRLTSKVAGILGSNQANHLVNQLHYKLPKSDYWYPFHQDSTNRRYGTSDWEDKNSLGGYVQTIIAIDEVTKDNGPLVVIPGSHKLGHLDLDFKTAYETGEQTDLSPYYSKEEGIPLLMQPGDVVLFGPFLIHGSNPNTSNHSRRVLINGFAYPGANKREFDIKGPGELIDLF